MSGTLQGFEQRLAWTKGEKGEFPELILIANVNAFLFLIVMWTRLILNKDSMNNNNNNDLLKQLVSQEVFRPVKNRLSNP